MSKSKSEGGKTVVDLDVAIPGPDFSIPDESEPIAKPDDEPAAVAAPSEPPPLYFKRVAVDVPLGDVPVDAYITNHVEVRLTHDQAYALRGLWYGLQAAGERLDGGKPIASNADVIRWLLEQVSRQTAAAESES